MNNAQQADVTLKLTKKMIMDAMNIDIQSDDGGQYTESGTHTGSLLSTLKQNGVVSGAISVNMFNKMNNNTRSNVFSTIDENVTARRKNLSQIINPIASQKSELQFKPTQFTSLPKLVDDKSGIFNRRAASIMQTYSDPQKLESQPNSATKRKVMLSNYFLDELQTGNGSLASLPTITERQRNQTSKYQSAIKATNESKIESVPKALKNDGEALENSEVKLQGIVVEEWINKVLKIEDDEKNSLPNREQGASSNKNASWQYGVDLQTMQDNSIPLEAAKRIQRALYVHSVGFHQLLKENTKGCKNQQKLLANIWIAYQALLERCHKSTHRMLIYELAQSMEEEKKKITESKIAAITAESDKYQALMRELKDLKTECQNLQMELKISQTNCISLETQINQQKQEGFEQSKMRMESEQKLMEMQTNQRMQELRLRKFAKVTADCEEETQRLKNVEIQHIKDSEELNLKVFNMEKEVQRIHQENDFLAKAYKIDLKGYDQLKEEFKMQQQIITDLQNQLMEREKASTEDRLKVVYISNDNEALRQTIKNLQNQLSDAQDNIEQLKKGCDDNTAQLVQLQGEYFQFRQDNLDADTQIRDLTAAWREASEILIVTSADLKKTKQLLDEERSQVNKMRERQKTLELEHKDVANHVHTYYTEIAHLERKLTEEIQRGQEADLDREKAEYTLKQFMQNEYAKMVNDIQKSQQAYAALQVKLSHTIENNGLDIKKLNQQIKDLATMNVQEGQLKRDAQNDVAALASALAKTKNERLQLASRNAELQLNVKELIEKNKIQEHELTPIKKEMTKLKSEILKLRGEVAELNLELSIEKERAVKTQVAHDKIIDQMKLEIKEVQKPYVQLYEQNAMIGEDMRSRAMVNHLKIFELMGKINEEKDKTETQQKGVIRQIRLTERKQQAFTLRQESLYEEQRKKDQNIKALDQIIRDKQDEINEFKHENRRLCDQTKQTLNKILIEHVTLETMTEYPVMVDAEVDNVAVVMDQCEGQHFDFNDKTTNTILNMQSFLKPGESLPPVLVENTKDQEVLTDPIDPEIVYVEVVRQPSPEEIEAIVTAQKEKDEAMEQYITNVEQQLEVTGRDPEYMLMTEVGEKQVIPRVAVEVNRQSTVYSAESDRMVAKNLNDTSNSNSRTNSLLGKRKDQLFLAKTQNKPLMPSINRKQSLNNLSPRGVGGIRGLILGAVTRND